MNAQDIKFLSELKNELLTQPTDGNCDPRFWGVKQRRREYGFEPEYADGYQVFDGEMCEPIGEPDNAESVVTALDEYFKDAEYPISWRGVDASDIAEIVERANDSAADAGDFSHGYMPFSIVYYKDFYEVSNDALFITKSACEEHIRRYRYNYTEPHTYVMTAERCPEYEALLRIIKETDWKAEEENADG